MSQTNLIEQLVERVERLLVRYEELQRTNELLSDQMQEITAERDQLKQRLGAARARVDTLLERIAEPSEAEPPKEAS
jgi:uncharacterized coiled-coil DUF342 family protein